ncbi:MAG: serine--tRNA ligase, partial [Nanoarchaeota archaeon]|nr:serine--tRNA ligase [Nanoarchaeota archaeon]
MIDIRLIRSNPKIVIQNLKKRDDKEKVKWVEEIQVLDEKWRSGLQQIDKLRHKRNEVTQEISKLKQEKKPVTKQIKEVKEIP